MAMQYLERRLTTQAKGVMCCCGCQNTVLWHNLIHFYYQFSLQAVIRWCSIKNEIWCEWVLNMNISDFGISVL